MSKLATTNRKSVSAAVAGASNFHELGRNVANYIQAPLLHEHWYVCATRDEITRDPIAKTILGHSIVFYRTQEGKPVALQNRCLHRSFPLAKSRLEGDELVCGYHGARYDSDGKLLRIPCQKNVPDRALRSYPLKEMGPMVFVWMGKGEPDNSAFEAINFLEDSAFRSVQGSFEIAASYLLMQENLNDFTHFAFLHNQSFGVEEDYAETSPDISRKDGKVFSLRAEHDSDMIRAVLTPPGVASTLAGRSLVRYDESHSVSPGVFVSRLWTEVDGDPASADGLRAYILHMMTPVSKNSCLYWWMVAFNHGQDEDEFFEVLPQFLLGGFSEDVTACEDMQRLLEDDSTDFDELNITGDRAGLHFRKILLDWAAQEYA
ncbi:aromatic ring-hydroxylating dioxygenase subunit alpha [Erythrobacter sp. G21629-S1]|nr:aromatic ring-hydroxylating dioxygenase subunit alpha [Erythrobacter sp. G21629-S1]